MTKPDESFDHIDWSLTTWDGSRREQLRRWAELPLEEVILAIEEMEEFAEALAAPGEHPGTPDAFTDFVMRMTPIDSTAIAKVGYDPKRQLLRLQYRNGRLYDYFNVPPQIYAELRSVDSAGEFVNRAIKPHYEYLEVEPAK